MAALIPSKRLAKKRAFAVKTAERRFVLQIAATKPTEGAKQRAEELRKKTARAKSADFLESYRVAA